MRLTVGRIEIRSTRTYIGQATVSRRIYPKSIIFSIPTRLNSQYRQLCKRIPVRGNGNVTLEHVLLYLPPGPFHAIAEDGADVNKDAEDEDVCVPATTNPSYLAASLPPSTTIVTVRYRLSASPLHRYKFPLPVHDALFALDWVRETYGAFPPEQHLASQDSDHNSGKVEPIISIYGSHIGASLATMLSLTEYPHIHSTAISSPILNWVDLDEKLQAWGTTQNFPSDMKSKHSRKTPKRRPNRKIAKQLDPMSVQRLLKLRDRLFTRPSSYFDPFASPMLILRNPGRDCPYDSMFDAAETEEDIDRIMLSDLEQNYNYSELSSMPDSGYESFGPYDDDMHIANDVMIQRRKTLNKWPIVRPSRSEKIKQIQPPFFNAILRQDINGEANILKEQGEELVELMGKCCFTKSQEQEYRERIGIERLKIEKGQDVERMEAERAALWFQKVWEEKRSGQAETGQD
ncbi:MAG: hypothetical protein Q9160_000316 [Pyrenula sp. 1 TL-2023]